MDKASNASSIDGAEETMIEEDERFWHVLAKNVSPSAIIKDKFHRTEPEDKLQVQREEETLRRVRNMYQRGPREKYERPLTTAHEYGWWWDCGQMKPLLGDQRLQHHIHDSAWLKERMRVFATDAGFKRQ